VAVFWYDAIALFLFLSTTDDIICTDYMNLLYLLYSHFTPLASGRRSRTWSILYWAQLRLQDSVMFVSIGRTLTSRCCGYCLGLGRYDICLGLASVLYLLPCLALSRDIGTSMLNTLYDTITTSFIKILFYIFFRPFSCRKCLVRN